MITLLFKTCSEHHDACRLTGIGLTSHRYNPLPATTVYSLPQSTNKSNGQVSLRNIIACPRDCAHRVHPGSGRGYRPSSSLGCGALGAPEPSGYRTQTPGDESQMSGAGCGSSPAW